MIRPFVHYGIHFLLPLIIVLLFFKKQPLKNYFIMLLGMLIDLDHLWANPIFDPNRCSIGFHFLHSYTAIFFYALACLPKKSRILGIGLLIHILADYVDCALIPN